MRPPEVSLKALAENGPERGREQRRVGHLAVTLVGSCIVVEVRAVTGRCQDFGNSGRGQDLNTAGPGGKLKNWKYEKLTVCTPDQHVWIPDFQIFTLHCHPRNSADGAERGEGNS